MGCEHFKKPLLEEVNLESLEEICWTLIKTQLISHASKVMFKILQARLQQYVIHTVKGFGKVNKAKEDVFLKLSSFFDDPEDVGNSISGSSDFSKSCLNIWKFMVHVLLKPGLENFEHYFANV